MGKFEQILKEMEEKEAQDAKTKLDMQENLKLFLAELTELTQKYGIEVYGCGCCNAVTTTSNVTLANRLFYDEETKSYEIGE